MSELVFLESVPHHTSVIGPCLGMSMYVWVVFRIQTHITLYNTITYSPCLGSLGRIGEILYIQIFNAYNDYPTIPYYPYILLRATSKRVYRHIDHNRS